MEICNQITEKPFFRVGFISDSFFISRDKKYDRKSSLKILNWVFKEIRGEFVYNTGVLDIWG